MSTTPYEEVASAPRVYLSILRPPAGTTRAQAAATLAALCTPNVPITAAIQERAGVADRVMLLRDPSVTGGTPSVEEYRALQANLLGSGDWQPMPGRNPDTRVLVMLGLRRGYDHAAWVHTRRDVLHHLIAVHGAAGVVVVDVHLMSARHLDGDAVTYEEPGVLIAGPTSILPAVTATADALGQHRFVVNDLDQNRTYALRRR